MTRSFATLLLLAVATSSAPGQSGSGSAPQQPPAPAGSGSQGSGTPQGSGAAGSGARAGDQLALDGYCPVCLVMGKGWVAGSTAHQVAFDGRTYRFPSAEVAATFQNDPGKFAPVLAGDDVLEFARSGRRVAGKTAFGAKYLDRYYFFASEQNKQAFTAAPTQFADADLAAGGACVVCQVDMQQAMPGDPRFTTVAGGMRYQFATAEQQQAFNAQPQRYTAAAAPMGSGTRPAAAAPAGSGSGGR